MNFLVKSILAVVLFFFATTANALSLEISLSSDFTSNVISADDANGDGVVNISAVEGINGGLGNWSINFLTGLSKPALGGGFVDILDLNSVNVTGNAGGTLYLRLTDTDFVGTDPMRFVTAFGGTTNGTVSFQSYVDALNAEFGQGQLLSDSGLLSGTGFSGENSGGISMTGPYSISIYAMITHSGAGQVTSFDYYVSVPEAGTLALVCIGLLGLGFFRRHELQRVN